MDRSEFGRRLETLLKEMNHVLYQKSSDYAPDEDVYNGMKLCENLGITTTEKGILVRMTDKIGRLSNLIDGIRAEIRPQEPLAP